MRVKGARVTGARVKGARVKGARVKGARVTGARVKEATVKGARVKGARVKSRLGSREQATQAAPLALDTKGATNSNRQSPLYTAIPCRRGGGRTNEI